jgi:hypothetical protein
MKDEGKAEGDRAERDAAANPDPGSDPSFILHPSSFHRIRLGPPWEVTATDSGTRHTRKFGRPRMLDANERLWLICDHVPGAAEVRVNGTPVGALEAAGPFAADLTDFLRQRNEVAFAVVADGSLGAVTLEVRTG